MKPENIVIVLVTAFVAATILIALQTGGDSQEERLEIDAIRHDLEQVRSDLYEACKVNAALAAEVNELVEDGLPPPDFTPYRHPAVYVEPCLNPVP